MDISFFYVYEGAGLRGKQHNAVFSGECAGYVPSLHISGKSRGMDLSMMTKFGE